MKTERRIRPDNRDEHSVLDSRKLTVLRELERYGYVAEPHSAASPNGAICRHPAAPSLLVCDDGRMELLSGRADRLAVMPSQPVPNPIRRARALLFLALLCITSFLGLLLVAMVVG